MNLAFNRNKLNMQTNTQIQAMPGDPSDDGKLLKFPIVMPIGDKTAPLADLNVDFEFKSGEFLAAVSVTYYDSPDGKVKTYPLGQFKVNPDQLLENAGIKKTNDNDLVLSLPTSPKQKKTNSTITGEINNGLL